MLSPRNEHHFLGAAIAGIAAAVGGIVGSIQQSSTNRANFRNTQITNQFNAQEAQKNRDWQEKMVDESREYNSPEAMISRGLNPFMSGSAAQTGAGSGSSPSGALGYNLRYWQWKTNIDTVHAAFRSGMAYQSWAARLS